jgi:hypothetical protein
MTNAWSKVGIEHIASTRTTITNALSKVRIEQIASTRTTTMTNAWSKESQTLAIKITNKK